MRKLALAVLAALAGACGGNDGNGGPLATALTVTGPVSGVATDAAGFTGTGSCTIAGLGAVSGSYLVALASTSPAVCSTVEARERRPGSTSVLVGVVRGALGNAAPALATGTYSVTSQPTLDLASGATWATARVVRLDAPACGETQVPAESGTVRIDSLSGGIARGTVDLRLANGGSATGTFVANACAARVDVQRLCAGDLSAPFGALTCR